MIVLEQHVLVEELHHAVIIGCFDEVLADPGRGIVRRLGFEDLRGLTDRRPERPLDALAAVLEVLAADHLDGAMADAEGREPRNEADPGLTEQAFGAAARQHPIIDRQRHPIRPLSAHGGEKALFDGHDRLT
jgi:hypothetical protein